MGSTWGQHHNLGQQHDQHQRRAEDLLLLQTANLIIGLGLHAGRAHALGQPDGGEVFLPALDGLYGVGGFTDAVSILIFRALPSLA